MTKKVFSDLATNAIEFYPQDFFLKYSIRLGTQGPIFQDLQTNKDHQENRKELFDKRSRTNK